MNSIERVTPIYALNALQDMRAFAKNKAAGIAQTILTAFSNPQSAQSLLFSMVVIFPLFNLAHLASLKYRQTDNSEWKEKANISFCSKAVITAKVISVIFFALIPVSLYLGMTQGIAFLKNRNFSDFIKAIRNISGAIGFCIPLSAILFQIKPKSIANELIFHLSGFTIPNEYQEISLIEKLQNQNLPITDEILTALKLPEGRTNDDVTNLALASRGLRTWEDFEKQNILNQQSFIEYLTRFESPGRSPAFSKIIEKKIPLESLISYLHLPANCKDEDLIRETLSSKGLTSLKDLQDHEILEESKSAVSNFQELLERYLNIFELQDNIKTTSGLEYLVNKIPLKQDEWNAIYEALECKTLPESLLPAFEQKGLGTIQDLFNHKILTNKSGENSPENVLKKLLKYFSKKNKHSIALDYISLLFGIHFIYEILSYYKTLTPSLRVLMFLGIFAPLKLVSSLPNNAQKVPFLQILILSICNIFNRLITPLIEVKSLKIATVYWAISMEWHLQKKIISIFNRISFHFEYYSRSISQPIPLFQHLYVGASQIAFPHIWNHFFRIVQIREAVASILEEYKRRAGIERHNQTG